MFNSHAYHANRCRREAAENLATARDIKARAARGEAYDWEIPRISHFAKLARLSASQARTFSRLRELQRQRIGR